MRSVNLINKLRNIKHILSVGAYNIFERRKQKLLFGRNLMDNRPKVDYLNLHTHEPRSIEIKKQDYLLNEVIISCYFIKKENPQTGEKKGKADFNYIKKWYESVSKIGINAIIIHDGIDEDFINRYETDIIQFRSFSAGNHPVIDERWIIYYMFIIATSIEKVFFTDIGDVLVTKSPFALISKKNQLFIGRDNANKIRLSGWILEEIIKFSNETVVKPPKSFYYQSLYNVGIVGGNRAVILFVLSKVIDLILRSDSNTYKEMTIFNIIIHNYFFPKLTYKSSEKVFVNAMIDESSCHEHLISGYPLNSLFKGFEHNSDAYFIHK